MRSKEFLTEYNVPFDLSADQELANVGDDFVFEMANLSSKQTGIKGVIFISTKMGNHGPRVKYGIKPGQQSFSMTIADNPRIVANSLPENIVSAVKQKVETWIQLNQLELLDFWNNGNYWVFDEVNAFISSLKKV